MTEVYPVGSEELHRKPGELRKKEWHEGRRAGHDGLPGEYPYGTFSQTGGGLGPDFKGTWLTLNDKHLLWELSGCRCGMCGVALSFNKACLDHDHETGKARGVLCHQCNLTLGHYESRARDIAAYLGRVA